MKFFKNNMVSNNLKKSLIPVISLSLCFVFILPAFCSDDTIKNESQKQTIKKGNLLHISVIGHENLTREETVNNDGNITFPLIKEIKAEGKTLVELAVVMEERLSEFIRYPRVTISYHNTFFIYGEVNRPGEYELRGNISVLKAIIIAGGFTDFASHKVKILKTSSKRKSIWVNIGNIIKGKEKHEDTLVGPGDIIIVPESFF